jgi:hypothetical protein
VLGELVLKVDGKFKVRSPLLYVLIWQFAWIWNWFSLVLRTQKIIPVLLKDLDVFSRNSVLASLDPLLHNVGGWSVPVGNGDEGRATYECNPEH